MIKLGKTYYYAKDNQRWTCVEARNDIGEQSTFLSSTGEKAKFYSHDMHTHPLRTVHRTIIVLLPKGTYNISISTSGSICGNSNASGDAWWRLSVPLPPAKGVWVIAQSIDTYDGVSLTLKDEYIN